MILSTTISKPILSSHIGKRLRVTVSQQNQLSQIILPRGSGPQGIFEDGDYIDFYVAELVPTSAVEFFGDGISAVVGSVLFARAGQKARAYYIGNDVWEVEPTGILSEGPPIIKPSPLVILAENTDIAFGSSADHNTFHRFDSTSDVNVFVKADSTFGEDEYWRFDFDPAYGDPGPMPIGGSAIFGKSGTGNVIFVPDAGVTINTPESLILSKLHGKVTLIKIGIDSWDLEGNIQPV